MLAASQVDIPGGELGSPGISIFLSGPKIGAVVSTGTDTWTVVVTGVMPKNNTWNNIAVRWEPLNPLATNQTRVDQLLKQSNYDTSVLGGLQLFLNLKKIGQSVLPETVGDRERCPEGKEWREDGLGSCAARPTSAKGELSLSLIHI